MVVRAAIALRALQLASGLAVLAGVPSGAWAAPPACDRSITVTPTTIPAGSRSARVRVSDVSGDAQLRASSGTVSAPVDLGGGFLLAELTTGSAPPPFAIVAVVGSGSCGWAVVRIATAATVPGRSAPASLVMVHPPEARADRDTEVLVHVFAVDDQGAPRRGRAPTFRPSVGSIAGVEALAPGVWRGRWHVPAGEIRTAGVEARFGAEPAGTASLARVPGSPATIELSLEPSGGPGGGGTPGSILVHIRDSAGNLTDAPLELEASMGRVGPPVRLDRGSVRASLEVPWTGKGEAAVVTARADGAVATLSIAPPSASAVRVAPLGPVRADGQGQTTLEVLDVVVVDAFGNPASDVPVGSGGRGEFREALSIEPGHWALLYRPPRILADATEQLVVTAGAASTTVELTYLASRGFFSAGLKAGMVVAGGAAGPAIGAEGGYWKRFGSTQLGLLLDVNWWMLSRTSTASVDGTATSYEATQNYLAFLLSLGWRTPIDDRWMLWAGLGGGGSVVSNSAQLGGQSTVSESGFAPAVRGSLSAGPRLGPGFLVLEARGTWVGDAGLSTLTGSVFTFLGLVGYRFDVG